MADPETARRLARALPETDDRSDDASLHFRVRGKLFAWSALERPAGGGRRLPRLDVLVLSCRPEMREIMIEAEPDKFFVTKHYAGYPTVLVHLEKVDEDELRSLLGGAWRLQAPAALARQFEEAG